jgi:hypothetical protein
VRREEIIATLNEAYIEATPGDLIDCPIASRSVLAHLRSLSSIGMDMENFRAGIVDCSIRAGVTSLRELRNVRPTRCDDADCRFCRESKTCYREVLIAAADKLEREKRGLCLDCVKHGRKPRAGESCRIEH